MTCYFTKNILTQNFENFDQNSQNFGNIWEKIFHKKLHFDKNDYVYNKKSNLLRISHT